MKDFKFISKKFKTVQYCCRGKREEKCEEQRVASEHWLRIFPRSVVNLSGGVFKFLNRISFYDYLNIPFTNKSKESTVVYESGAIFPTRTK